MGRVTSIVDAKPSAEPDGTRSFWQAHFRSILSVATAVIYFFSNPKPQNYYDYTFRVAGRMLAGGVGFDAPQPSWLNEFVPYGGQYFSVFPLGAVLTMIPAALLKAVGLITQMPGTFIAAACAGVICWMLLKIAERYEAPVSRQILMAVGVVFGTFMWTNLTFAGAWQLALGFAMVGELGAIYFTVFDRRPLLAGAFFALAFGNRTENLLTAPIFLYLLIRTVKRRHHDARGPEIREASATAATKKFLSSRYAAAARFCAIPFLLGVATLIYNYARFGDPTDFGYARIPGILLEPWYSQGIFSTAYVPRQAWEMLGKIWEIVPSFPFLRPDGFSNSIILSSPFLLLVLRVGARDGALKLASWAAIVILTFLLWIHGNSGGWQFGYRYAMILLPWIFLIMLESAPKRITRTEWALYWISFAANLYATWIFHWTDYLKP